MENQYKKRSNTIMTIAITFLMLFTIGGIIAGVSVASAGEAYMGIGFAVFAGCFLQGIIIFSILCGTALAAKNTEDVRDMMIVMKDSGVFKKETLSEEKDNELPAI